MPTDEILAFQRVKSVIIIIVSCEVRLSSRLRTILVAVGKRKAFQISPNPAEQYFESGIQISLYMNASINGPLALIILDGWGFAPPSDDNAIALAHTPYYDEICSKFPRTSISASGIPVGLADAMPGNAEIGHIQLGAGRVVGTEASRIADAISSGAFFENSVLKSEFEKAAGSGGAVHLIGLLSDGGIHSSPDSLYALLRMAKRNGAKEVFVHGILDGRDVPPRTADIYVEALEVKLADIGIGRIASLCGRFYAMDGTGRWERTARAFTMLVHGEGERSSDPLTAVRSSFLRGISDEFIAPIVIESEQNEPVAKIKDGDLVIFFNHRADTMRQLVRSLGVPEPGETAAASKPAISVVCLTQYDKSFGLPAAFDSSPETNSLARILADNGIGNLRISETDRFQHVTRFFNCGDEAPLNCEEHIEVSSQESEIRDADPEMQSFKIADKLISGIETGKCSFFVANFPAADMSAETGDLGRTIEAIQFVDTCLGGVLDAIRERGGTAIITSTHGHCEQMKERTTGEANRFPSANPVPFHIINEKLIGKRLREGGCLSDVAPTILSLLGINNPPEMTGRDLRNS